MNLGENCIESIKRPPTLTPGDTIGIAAPASPFKRETFERGLTVLRELGFNPLVRDDIFLRNRYLAGGDRLRADILMHLLGDSDVKGVICARGGYGSMRLLPYLNFDAITMTPKVFIGFSDVTALLVNLVERCNWTVFHGPTVTSLGQADPESCQALQSAVSAKKPITLSASHGNVIFQGVATGPLMVGNLTTLCHLVGTPFMPDLRGCILMLEDRGEALYRIDRMLTQMKMAGCFEHLTGLALGHFTECGAAVDIEAVVGEMFQEYHIPILSGFGVGHAHRNLTLPLGLNTTLDTHNRTLSLQTAATS